MKQTVIAAASSFVLALGLAGAAAAAESGASMGTDFTGTGVSQSPVEGEIEAGTRLPGGTAMSGGKSVPSFSELDRDSKGHLTKQDLQDYPELQTQWQQIDVDKNDQIDQAELSAFEAGAEWQKKQQEGGSASEMDKPGYQREQGGSATQPD
jgi:hypothetical protein